MSLRYGNTYRAFGWLIVVLTAGFALAVEPAIDQDAEQKPLIEDQGDGDSQPDTSGENQTDAPDNTQSTRELAAFYAQIEALVSDLAAALRDPNAEREQQRGDKDLRAQKDMAFYAMLMFFAVLAQTAITAFGVWLVRSTLIEARKATLAAVAATEAAESAVEVTSDTAQRQLRAYVFVVEALRTRRGDTDPWVIQVRIKNFRQTPAYRAQVRVKVKIMDPVDEATFGFPLPTTGDSQFDFGPGHEHTTRIEIPGLAGDVWDDFKAGRIAIYLWGRVDFVDAFNENRWMHFRHIQQGGYILNLSNCTKGNETSESENF